MYLPSIVISWYSYLYNSIIYVRDSITDFYLSLIVFLITTCVPDLNVYNFIVEYHCRIKTVYFPILLALCEVVIDNVGTLLMGFFISNNTLY